MHTHAAGICVYVLLCVVSNISSAASDDAEPVDAPKYTVGDSWAFKTAAGREYTKTIAEVSGDSYVLVHSSYPGVRFRFDQNLSVKEIEGDFKLDKRITVGWRYIDFPMKVGKKFSYRVEGSRSMFAVDSTATKWVAIDVPAGTFRALEIESCWRNESSGWTGYGMKYWYAPAVKDFVKRKTPSDWLKDLQNNDFELLSSKVQN